MFNFVWFFSVFFSLCNLLYIYTNVYNFFFVSFFLLYCLWGKFSELFTLISWRNILCVFSFPSIYLHKQQTHPVLSKLDAELRWNVAARRDLVIDWLWLTVCECVQKILQCFPLNALSFAHWKTCFLPSFNFFFLFCLF